MNRFGYYYNVEYRLDDIEDYDSTDYSDDYNTMKEAKKFASEIKREFGKRVVLLDIHKYDEEELIDTYPII